MFVKLSKFGETQQIGKTVATGLEKGSFHSNPKERQCQRLFKLADNWLISYASKVMFKILQARLQQYVNQELLEVQVGFRKDRGTRDQIANISWIIEKAREFQQKKKKKKFTSASLTMLTPCLWLCGSQQTVENS